MADRSMALDDAGRQSGYSTTSPEVDKMVLELLGRVADKWTMLVLETLEQYGCLRFTKLSGHIGGVSQKMLTKTLRQMEYDGLVKRTVFPVIPPRVEYQLTELGRGLTAAFCGVWVWVEANHERVKAARENFRGTRPDSENKL